MHGHTGWRQPRLGDNPEESARPRKQAAAGLDVPRQTALAGYPEDTVNDDPAVTGRAQFAECYLFAMPGHSTSIALVIAALAGLLTFTQCGDLPEQ